MAFCLTEKGARVVDLIRAVDSAGVLVPGDKVQMPNERPATYIRPVVQGNVQMHEFRLFDGTEIIMEVPALTAALAISNLTMPQTTAVM